jgi:protein SCO1/2
MSLTARSAFIISLLTITAGVGCDRAPAAREYPLQGQILKVEASRTQASVKHEEIPGFMAAMTMDYKVREAKEYEGLQPGDLITATLVVESSDGYLRDVKKVGTAPLPGAAPSASSGFELLKPGEAVPNTTFVDQDGTTREFASYQGKTVVLTFIYTTCPLPTFCPLMDRHFATMQAKIKADPALKDVRLLSVSFDPINDTPAVLKKHAATLHADPERWTFVTGDRDDIDKFASRFGVTITRDMNDMTNIAHNLRTAIVDAKGTLAKAYTGNEWSPEEVLADLATVAKGN